MKREDLFDAITDVRDDLVEDAAAPIPRKRRPTRAALAAVLALVLLGGALLGPRLLRGPGGAANPSGGAGEGLPSPVTPGGTSSTLPSGPSSAGASSGGDLPGTPVVKAIAEVSRPARAVWTEEGDNSEWNAEWQESRDLAETYHGLLNPFLERALPALLDGAGTDNRVCSPLNLYLSLSALAEMTEGESRQQILDLLGCDSLETARQRAGDIWNVTYADDGILRSLPATSLWLSDTVFFDQGAMNTLADSYRAASWQVSMGTEEADQALRGWLNENTGNLLTDQSAAISLEPNQVLSLVSTLWYKAPWKDRFQEEKTAPGTFHTPGGDRTVDFLHSNTDQLYWQGEHFSAVSLPLSPWNHSMFLLLPDEGTTPEDLLRDPEVLAMLENPAEAQSSRPEVHLALPKFDVVSDLDLTDTLRTLGVKDILDPQLADFSAAIPNSSDGLAYLSSAQHATRISIDEEGCTGASYVDLELVKNSQPTGQVDFVLDRPFLFVLEGTDGVPLFAGIVNQP